MTRAINLGSTIEEERNISPEDADVQAIASDWEAVGNDLRKAMSEN